ncbi:MAG TPA: hypothetical protein VM711_02770, partial [Sphingomicrobium sp.]|nr:hypothetical protein [Sphingomicrobium sp.]
MLYQELPRIDSTPLDKWGRWLTPTLIGAAALTAAIGLLLLGNLLLAGVAFAAGLAGAGVALRRSAFPEALSEAFASGTDYSLVGSALGLCRDPVALTDAEASLLVVNGAYRTRFGNASPLQLAATEEALQGLKLAQSMALRDGAGCVAGIKTTAGTNPVQAERVGLSCDLLLWRFPGPPAVDSLTIAVRRVEGLMGQRLAFAGVMAATVDSS